MKGKKKKKKKKKKLKQYNDNMAQNSHILENLFTLSARHKMTCYANQRVTSIGRKTSLRFHGDSQRVACSMVFFFLIFFFFLLETSLFFSHQKAAFCDTQGFLVSGLKNFFFYLFPKISYKPPTGVTE